MKNKHQKGFTLIEVVIYIALFSILLGGGFVTAYQLIDSSRYMDRKNNTHEEANFVMRKLNWALTGIENITIPREDAPTSDTLTVSKYNGDIIYFRLRNNKIEIKENTNTYLPITTDNVKVSNLNFKFIPAIGSNTRGTEGIIATATIDGVDFTITKYIRQ